MTHEIVCFFNYGDNDLNSAFFNEIILFRVLVIMNICFITLQIESLRLNVLIFRHDFSYN
jgi:hypothetical protein